MEAGEVGYIISPDSSSLSPRLSMTSGFQLWMLHLDHLVDLNFVPCLNLRHGREADRQSFTARRQRSPHAMSADAV